MRARTWPATLRPQRKGYWDASDRARQQIARHAAEDGPMWPMEAETLTMIGRLFADFERSLKQMCIKPAACERCLHPHVRGVACSSVDETHQMTCGCTS